MRKCSHGPEWPLLAIAVLIGVTVYFWKIYEVGMSHWDEFYFIDSAKRIMDIKGSTIHPWDPLVYPSIIVIFFRLFGMHDYVAVATSATFAVLSIPLTFILGSSIFNRKVGVLAALILSLVEYQIIYARVALSDMTLAFFFTVSMLTYYTAFQTRRLGIFCLAGFTTAICLGIKYNGFQPLVIAVLYFVAKQFDPKTLLSGIKRQPNMSTERLKSLATNPEIKGLVIATSIPLVLTILALAYLGSALMYHELNVPPYFLLTNFIEALSRGCHYFLDVVWENKAYYLRLRFPNTFYLSILSIWISPAVHVFSAIGAFLSVKMREKGGIFLSIWILYLLTFFSSMSFKFPRVILPILPALTLLCARGLFSLRDISIPSSISASFHISKKLLMSLCLALIMLSSLCFSMRSIGATHSAYRSAAMFMNDRIKENDVVWIDSQPVILLYMKIGVCSYQRQDIEKARYIFVDFVAATRSNLSWILETVKSRRMTLLAEYPFPESDIVLLDWLSYADTSRAKHLATYNTVRIYGIGENTTSALSRPDIVKDHIPVFS